jgi:hypothetical protein
MLPAPPYLSPGRRAAWGCPERKSRWTRGSPALGSDHDRIFKVDLEERPAQVCRLSRLGDLDSWWT